MIIITLITSMIVIIIVIILPQSKRERAQITFLTALYGTAKAEVINVPTLPIHKVGIRSVVALKQFVHFLEPFTFESGEDLLL